MSLQSELCLWTLLGLMRTIFDATLFKVNANLKQVWQMTMPAELSMPVQRGLRTMISGVMLVQCFTVYVYLASYIVLLYPIFLEERPTLVLPWLLLAAIRKFLCELTSLTLGLGVCLLVGPARPACIRFVVFKIASIIPAVYMWLLVLSYYNTLKVTAAFKRFPAVLPPGDVDYGLELAVRRRRTKSLMDEKQLRKRIVENFSSYSGEGVTRKDDIKPTESGFESSTSDLQINELENNKKSEDIQKTSDYNSANFSNLVFDRSVLVESYEDWSGSELVIPRGTDRIMEQFILMLLRIGAHISKQGTDPGQVYSSHPPGLLPGTLILGEDTETPPSVGNDRTRTTSYLQQYPQIFMKKDSTRLRTGTNSSDDSNKNMRWSENVGKSIKISEMLADYKATFESRETTFQEMSEMILKEAGLVNNTELTNRENFQNLKLDSSTEKYNQTVDYGVGSSKSYKNDVDNDDEKESKTETTEIKKKKSKVKLDITDEVSRSSQTTIRDNDSKTPGNEDVKSINSDKQI